MKPVAPCKNCINSGTVHNRCFKYKKYRADLDTYNNFVNSKKRCESDYNKVRSHGATSVCGGWVKGLF